MPVRLQYVPKENKSDNQLAEISIEESNGLYYLIYLFTDGSGGDTCHLSVQEAKKQAEYSFGVPLYSWTEYADNR